MKKASIILSLALAATVVAFAQEKPAPAPAPAPKPAATTPAAAAPADADPVICSASGISIRKSEFEGALKTLPPEYQQFAMGAGKKQFAEDYLRMRLLAQEGAKEGLQNDPDVVRQLDLMRANLLATAELKKIEKTVTVTDEDLKKYYEDNKKEYEQVHARHILIAPKGSAAAPPAKDGKKELTDEEAKAKAEELRGKLAAGGDFALVAKSESADTGSAAQGGDLGSFGHGQMVPEFEEAAFKAKPGEITPVVKTQFGYHIIKVESHDFTPFEQVKPTIEKAIRQKKMQAVLDSMKTASNPTFDEAYFATAKMPPSAMREDGEHTPPPAPAPAKPATKKH